MSTQKGFTLIEIMVVTAIVGILAAIAFPAYSRYQGRAKATAGLAELVAITPLYEEIADNGGTPTFGAMGITTNPTKNCILGISTGDLKTLSCALVSAPSEISSAMVVLTRSNNSGWTCSVSGMASSDYLPKGCLSVPP
jgi:type IV pilus assembly protein PilA